MNFGEIHSSDFCWLRFSWGKCLYREIHSQRAGKAVLRENGAAKGGWDMRGVCVFVYTQDSELPIQVREWIMRERMRSKLELSFIKCKTEGSFLPAPHVHKSILYICISIAALQIGSSVSSFWIPSDQFSRSVVSDSLWPHESQHARPLCLSQTPWVYSNSCPSSRWCHPAISTSVIPFSSSPIPPNIRVFSNESALHMRWPNYWSFSFSISPFNEHPGLISFRIDWLDFLAVQGTLKRLLQHHSSKASIFWRPAFFTVHLSHPYMTTGKTIGLTRWTFVGKVMSLLFNMLSRLVITFLPRSVF